MFFKKKKPVVVTPLSIYAGRSKPDERILKLWEPELLAQQNRMLIHTVRYETGPLFDTAAQLVFASWDVISTSLVYLDQILPFGPNSNFEPIQSRITGAFAEIGFELEVRPQNILGTFDADVGFPNHAGVNQETGQVTHKYELSESIFSGKIKGEDWIERGGFNQLKSPSSLHHYEDHNEILVIGKSNIRIYDNFPATAPVKVKRIWIIKKHKPSNATTEAKYEKILMAFAEKLARVNPGMEIKMHDAGEFFSPC